MIVIESTGRKLKDAIDNGLNELKKTLDEVEVEVLDNGGLFRKAKVRITVHGEDPVPTEKKEIEKKTDEIKTDEIKVEKQERPVTHERVPERSKERKEHRPKEVKEQVAKTTQKETPEQKTIEEHVEAEKKEPRHYEPVTPEVVKKAEDFVTALIQKMGFDAKISTTVDDGKLTIALETESSPLIGYHGEVLDSIEYITNYVINREAEKFYHVVVDCNGYRDKRRENLVALANKMAAKCLKTHHKVSLEAMNSNERKIIHSTLSDNDRVITRSEGHEPNRHVVIMCKKK